MKKLFYFVGLVLTFAVVTVANATYSSGYKDPQTVDYLNFTATLQSDGSVKTDWSSYSGDLKYYKVVRSQTNSDPVYPDDGYIFYSSSVTEYTDKNPQSGKNYYRVCAITKSSDRLCSNVVALESSSAANTCIQVITYAKKGSECKSYATPCDVPSGWTKVDSCDSSTLSNSEGNLALSVTLKDDKPYLSWGFEGEGSAPKGYKLAISTKNKNPTYPVMSGDSYKYLSSENTKSYHDKNAYEGKTYYYRVCLYLGSGKCGDYSNAVAITVPGSSSDKNKDTEIYGNLKLSVELKDAKPRLTWDFIGDGSASKGYKVAISTKNKNPTYPAMSGDSYKYLSNENIKSYRDSGAKEGKVYYYRVCVYLGSGKCGEYSNAVTIAVPAESDNSNSIVAKEKKTDFSDVKAGIWFESYLSSFVKRGIIEGYSDGSFQPSKTVNRAEMAKMVVKALDVKVESSDMQIFCDVNQNDWFQPYVLHLYFESIVEGYIGGTCANKRLYNPSKEVTRAEAIKIILTMFDAEVEPLGSGDQTGFTDVPTNHWAAAYIRTAFSKGIVNGYDDGTFQPTTPLTRAEFVKMLSEAEDVLK